MNPELKGQQALHGGGLHPPASWLQRRRGPCPERGKQTQRRRPGLHAPHLTSTSRQLPGTKWMESSFSRPTMPAVFAPPQSRPQPPPAQHSRGPQRPRPWPSSPRPWADPGRRFRLPPPWLRLLIGRLPPRTQKGAGPQGTLSAHVPVLKEIEPAQAATPSIDCRLPWV